jgi:hypothetical protein
MARQCGSCGGKRAAGVTGTSTVQSSQLKSDEYGLIPLASQPDCTRHYYGQFTGAQVFVVARGTPHEKLFLKGRFKDAIAYMRSHSGATVDRVRVVDLCHDAVVALLGA